LHVQVPLTSGAGLTKDNARSSWCESRTLGMPRTVRVARMKTSARQLERYSKMPSGQSGAIASGGTASYLQRFWQCRAAHFGEACWLSNSSKRQRGHRAISADRRLEALQRFGRVHRTKEIVSGDSTATASPTGRTRGYLHRAAVAILKGAEVRRWRHMKDSPLVLFDFGEL